MARVKDLDAGIGWKALAKKLAIIEYLINANDPVKGHGIRIDETDTGTIISVDPKQDDANQPDLTGGTWTTVTIVDPGTCIQSQIQVLTRPVPQ
jgi:hypothetical protein